MPHCVGPVLQGQPCVPTETLGWPLGKQWLHPVTMNIFDLGFWEEIFRETVAWLFASPSRGWGQERGKGHVRREVNENREAATGGPAFLAQGSDVAFDESPLAVSLAGFTLCSCSPLSLLELWGGEGLQEHTEQAVLFPTTGNPLPDHSRHPRFQNKTLMCLPLGQKIDPDKKEYEKHWVG